MMNSPFIADTVFYIGVNDKELNRLEGQQPSDGEAACNSYVILDEQTAVIHPVKEMAADRWLAKLKQATDGEPVDYLIMAYAEPEFAESVRRFMSEYPEAKLVGSAASFDVLGEELCGELEGRLHQVEEGSVLELGHDTVQFYEVPSDLGGRFLVIYENLEELLFSSGTMESCGRGAGEYLERIAELPVQKVCPMYGPLRNDKEPSGSMTDRKASTGRRKTGFWKMFAGARII